MKINIFSTAFNEGEMIPKQYTCDGNNISPPLTWTGIPANAKTLALIADDPDAPSGTFVHWVLFNIPSQSSGLEENHTPGEEVRQGTNSYRRTGYRGPCPPGGTHRYFFKIYALDTVLKLAQGATKDQLIPAMEGHILAEGALMGRYLRS